MRTLLLLLIYGISLAAAPPLSMTKEQRVMDFYALTRTMESSYGMLEFKKANILQADYNQTKKQFFIDVSKATTDEQFYKLMKKYFVVFKDGHLYIDGVYSLDKAILKVYLAWIEGKVVVLGRGQGAPASIGTGDQVLEIDGKAIDQLMAELRTYQGSGGTEAFTMRAIVDKIWIRSSNIMLPQGSSALIKLKKYSDGSVYYASVPWQVADASDIYSRGGSRVLDQFAGYFEGSGFWGFYPGMIESRQVRRFIDSHMLYPIELEDSMTSEVLDVSVGSAAYKIGRIRVPDYTSWDEDIFDYHMNVVKDCDGLILDQRCNGGGAFDYCQHLVSWFLDSAIDEIEFSVPLNRFWLFYIESKLISAGSQAQYDYLVQWRDKLFAEAAEGKKMSSWVPLFFESNTLEPREKGTFTKPVVMMIDSSCFSCGDFAPAYFKQKDMTSHFKLFGETTGGGGGNVVPYRLLPQSEMCFHMTQSIARRKDGSVIENKGVDPDIVSPYTVEDMVNEMVNKQDTYMLKALTELISMISTKGNGD
ncbi:MAG: S41 family peptidase [Candidatus Wallbacteria bacterium]|nr:S41 family peptidase [Candidatus Wallbacteria bacterium]